MDTHIKNYLSEAKKIIDTLDSTALEKVILICKKIRMEGKRLFFIGMGGGAANASHAVNDFRKIAGIEAYTPVDNISELTARSNDDGLSSIFKKWLMTSHLGSGDGVFVLSVGGGDEGRNISVNIVEALKFAKDVGATVMGIVGRDGGFTAKIADACVIIPIVNPDALTPHTESFQSLILHLIVSHPELKVAEMKWEATK